MANSPKKLGTEAARREALEAFGQARLNQKMIKVEGTSNEIITDVSVRAPFGRGDYDSFRPGEAIPKKFPDIVRACRAMYLSSGVVRTVINLMTDFAFGGATISCRDKDEEAFYRVWAKRVNLPHVMDEFGRHFIIDSNTAVKRITARLNKPIESDWMRFAQGEIDFKVTKQSDGPDAREIPWRYMFLDVTRLKWLGGDLANMTGQRQLVMPMDPKLLRSIQSPKTDDEKELIRLLPKDMREQLAQPNIKDVKLDMSKIYVAHNKKDEWEDWAMPSLYAVLSDNIYKEKLRLAEMAALDGVINVIRIWKLGDHKEGVLPTAAAVQKLINILQANTGGGAFDLVWDSLLTMEEHYPPVDKILGSEKYQQVNQDILIGLGVPEVLIGGRGANFSNSFIQVKTLLEKLEHTRAAALDWIMGEFEFLAKAMGLKNLPVVEFDQNSLQDENAARQLIIQLMDRGVVSVETVQKVFGNNFELEVGRLENQKNVFEPAVLPEEPKEGLPLRGPFIKPPTAGGGGGGAKPGGGRPANTRDISRKTRTPKPRTKATLLIKAGQAINEFDANVLPVLMRGMGAANARRLTASQREEITSARQVSLACINPTTTNITEAIATAYVDTKLALSISQAVAEYVGETGEEPTLAELKQIEAMAWAEYFSEHDTGDGE